jgi:toxin ParE1/3/4
MTIALENRSAAQKVLHRLRTKVSTLSNHPRLGPRRDEIRRGLRVLVERPYLIFYRLSADVDDQQVLGVDIVRVVDGRRNLGSLF